MRYALKLFTTSTVKKTTSTNTAATVHGGERGDLSQKPGFLDSGSTLFVMSCSLVSILASRPWKSAVVPRASTRENSVVQYIMPCKDGMPSSPKYVTDCRVFEFLVSVRLAMFGLTVGVGGHYTRLSATWRKPPQPLENTRFNQVGTGLAFFSAPACPVPRAGYSG